MNTSKKRHTKRSNQRHAGFGPASQAGWAIFLAATGGAALALIEHVGACEEVRGGGEQRGEQEADERERDADAGPQRQVAPRLTDERRRAHVPASR